MILIPHICERCGFVDPPAGHIGGRMCHARQFIDTMKGNDLAPSPERRWTLCFRKEGVRVIHGPISLTRTGNWIKRGYLETLALHRKNREFCRLPYHLQVAAVVWWVERGQRPQPQPPAPPA